jgi:hypothetical protein
VAVSPRGQENQRATIQLSEEEEERKRRELEEQQRLALVEQMQLM